MERKQCYGCGKVKDISEYYERGSKYDCRCKACRQLVTKKWRERNPDKVEAYVAQNRANARRHYKEKLKGTRAYRDRHNEEQKRVRMKHPKRWKTRHNFCMAVYRGKIKRGACVICDKPNAEGHHPDYDKPFEVIWLCHRHHCDLHIGELEVVI